ncbi:hypothetical protein Hamer_G007861 [Homarus americanus]|uniref:Uncharacterized protein n=1 Tax=Homarus americanus TaxID=6706 RepID=A0A8J5JQN8_HOMAM|nr:hypothetical protein Hamer_G007861 [Homarus americanus]
MGLKMKFSAIRYFPYNDYTPDSSEPGSTVTLKDCLDARLLSVLEPALNCRRTVGRITVECVGVGRGYVAAAECLVVGDRRSWC